MQTVKLRSPLYLASRRTTDNPTGSIPVPGPVATHLALHTADGIQMIAIREIIRVASDSNYCTIYCSNDRRLTASRTLGCVEKLLPADQFARIHQSHVVRVSEMKIVRKDEVVLTCGARLPLSRNQRNHILTQLEAFSARI